MLYGAGRVTLNKPDRYIGSLSNMTAVFQVYVSARTGGGGNACI